MPCAIVLGLLTGSMLFLWAGIAILVDWVRSVWGGGPVVMSAGYWVEAVFNITISPLLAMVLGGVAGFAFAGIYNVWAKYVGGIEVDLKLKKE